MIIFEAKPPEINQVILLLPGRRLPVAMRAQPVGAFYGGATNLDPLQVSVGDSQSGKAQRSPGQRVFDQIIDAQKPLVEILSVVVFLSPAFVTLQVVGFIMHLEFSAAGLQSAHNGELFFNKFLGCGAFVYAKTIIVEAGDKFYVRVFLF